MVRRAMIPALLLTATPVAAQLALPHIPDVVSGTLRTVTDTVRAAPEIPSRVAALAQTRLDRIATMLREHRTDLAPDDHGDPARAGTVLVSDPDDALIAAATAAGFVLAERGDLEGLGIGFARFDVPLGKSLVDGLRTMRKLARGHDVSADQVHFESGAVAHAATPSASAAQGPMSGAIGMIDGGVGAVDAPVTRRGFAAGAPSPDNHGTAIASLLIGGGGVRGAAVGARLYAADVYGKDPAGGNALAIAKALAWLASVHVPVTVISLVGPANPLLARVVAAVQTRGMIVVAAVGNDGPAAPPSYPASYPGVIAVTGVDGRGRALIEAGRSLHLDYAAPGADMLAATAQGGSAPVRGTSFAAPLVAARLARLGGNRAAAVKAADSEARKAGPASRYGRGILCESCRTPAK
ncbi:Subtilase family protein [Sphingomonas sp. NFR15]|nr:Subtilase family protein [Sphingomonas sp. NFR15]